MKLLGSGSMLVILIDTIKLLSSSNLPKEKNNSLSKPNISILNIILWFLVMIDGIITSLVPWKNGLFLSVKDLIETKNSITYIEKIGFLPSPSDNTNTMSAPSNVIVVKPLHQKCVSVVAKIELIIHIVHVLMDIMKMKPSKPVLFAEWNV